MAHWPKTVRGKLLALSLCLAAAPLVWMLVVRLWHPVVGGSIAVIALICVALYIWRHKVRTAHDLAVADGFSFGDVVRRIQAADLARDPLARRSGLVIRDPS